MTQVWSIELEENVQPKPKMLDMTIYTYNTIARERETDRSLSSLGSQMGILD